MNCTRYSKQKHKIDGKKVMIARAEKGWTLSKLASESGVNRKTIGEIEKGSKKIIRSSTIDQLALSLEKPLEYFYKEDKF